MDILNSLKYEFQPKQRDIFEFGDQGEKFYMILEGEVSVVIPNPECKDFQHRYEELQKEREWDKRIEEQSKVMHKQIELAKRRIGRVEIGVKELT